MATMKPSTSKSSQSKRERDFRCLACGTTRNMGTRKYCSLDCRQQLRYTLNIRTGLLKALNTRYATFYFTDRFIIMDVLPYDTREIFSFIYPRSPGKKPADTFRSMANLLGRTWWDEKNRTNKNYLATRLVMTKATRDRARSTAIQPPEKKIPVVTSASLVALKLNKTDLDSSALYSRIKKAYRLQAKKHHPDRGGSAEMFRKLHHAYQELLQWAESPTFINRRGFPDKWFYDGDKNRWTQPTPR
jgi:hypothetical protein